MNKFNKLPLAFLTLLTLSMAGQGPLNTSIQVANSKELVLFMFDTNSSDELFTRQMIYDFDENYEFINQQDQSVGTGGADFGAMQSAIATGDFNNDGREDYALAHAAPNGQIELFVPQIGIADFDISSGNTLFIDANLPDASYQLKGIIRAEAGDLDGDGADDFVVAYRNNADGKIHLEAYSSDENLNISLLSQIADLAVPLNDDCEPLDIAVGDLDGDGDAELVLAAAPSSGSTHLVSARVYDFIDGAFSFVSELVVNNNWGTWTGVNLSIACGDTNADGELEVVFAQSMTGINGEMDTYIDVLLVDDDVSTPEFNPLEAITFDINQRLEYGWAADDNTTVPGNYIPLDLVCGDFNGDGRDEVVVGEFYKIHLFGGTDNNGLIELASENAFSGNNASYSDSKDFIDLGDVNGDGQLDIVTCRANSSENFPYYDNDLNVDLYTVNGNMDDIVSLGSLIDNSLFVQTNNQFQRKYALAFADMDGDQIELGEPSVYNFTEILQPLVVLNAPPIHFEKFGDEVFDISLCFNGNDCSHSSTYVWSTTTTQSTEIKVKNSWNVSSSLEIGGSYGPFSVKSKIEQSQASAIENFSSNEQTFQVTTQVTAIDDDLIYATVANYEIWEYPIYIGGEFAGNAMFVEPQNVQNQWFPSKSWTGNQYIPDHEVGEILSYKEYPNPSLNPNLEEVIAGGFQASDGFTLDANSGYGWQLGWTEFNQNGASTENEIKLKISGEAGIFGSGISAESEYSSTAFSSHTSAVQTELQLAVDLGHVDLGIGETRYTVYPYSYWANSGAFVLDFAAKPELPAIGGTDTWWSTNYGELQDPAFILPWRLDPEKGYTLEDDEKRYQSKHIQFTPKYPQPGDTLTITAIVHNFSLLPTQGPVEVSFYLENPLNGGQLLEDLAGQTVFNTGIVLQPRESREVSMQWIYPSDLEFPKIYGYIDPNNEWTEIHETNNIGFNFIGNLDFTNSIVNQSPKDLKFLNIYPNPSDEYSWVEFAILNPSKVVLDIMDVDGRRVKRIVDQNLFTGEYRSRIDTQDLPTGIYFYRLSTEISSTSGKLVVLH